MRPVAGVCCLMMTLLIAGCGGEGGSLVQGTVSYADGAPLPKGVVNISGDGGSYRGKIEPDGKYTLENVPDGNYKVTITGAQEGGEPPEMKYDEKGVNIPQPTPPAKQLIDLKYSNIEDSGLTLTVPGDYNLKVEKAK